MLQKGGEGRRRWRGGEWTERGLGGGVGSWRVGGGGRCWLGGLCWRAFALRRRTRLARLTFSTLRVVQTRGASPRNQSGHMTPRLWGGHITQRACFSPACRGPDAEVCGPLLNRHRRSRGQIGAAAGQSIPEAADPARRRATGFAHSVLFPEHSGADKELSRTERHEKGVGYCEQRSRAAGRSAASESRRRTPQPRQERRRIAPAWIFPVSPQPIDPPAGGHPETAAGRRSVATQGQHDVRASGCEHVPPFALSGGRNAHSRVRPLSASTERPG